MKQIELLSPAGDMTILKAVLHAGADAVYVGGPAFGARAYAGNLSEAELLEAVDYAHIHGRKIYLTVNTLLKNKELTEQLYDYLLPYYERGGDAVIVQDFGVFTFVKEAFPGLAVHASTQMTVTGADGAAFLQKQGADRIVTARELSFAEIRQIKEETGIEIESFVHGALCYCYSGQCLLSSMLGGRSGNRGRCAQPCRLPYEVVNEDGENWTKGAKYLLSPKDLCAITMIPQLAECGIDSFKIEGRMKQAEYAAGVTSIYRKYLDRYRYYGAEGFEIEKRDGQRLLDLGNRSGFTKGYYVMHNGREMLTFQKPGHTKNEKLPEEIRQIHIQKDLQEKIKGKLKLFSGKNARLTVSFGGREFTVSGAVVSPAKKNPLERENVLERMKKTGNTPFIFEELEIEMEDGVFLPIGQLNALRREALEVLQESVLKKSRRDAKTARNPLAAENTAEQKGADGSPFLSVAIEKEEFLDIVCEKSYVKRVYLDADAFFREKDPKKLQRAAGKVKEAKKEVFLILPLIFREETRKRYEKNFDRICGEPLDGFLVRNYEELGFLQRHGLLAEIAGSAAEISDVSEGLQGKYRIQSDHNLYTYSDQAREAFLGCGVSRDTIPLELNLKELYHRDCSRSELILYGYLPLMVTAGCLHKSLGVCGHKEEMLFLKDRYGKYFPVKNQCRDCYNVIYNSAPLALFGMRQEVEKIKAASYRLHFSIEEGEEVRRILALFEKVYIRKEIWNKNSLKDYTNGHMKRGVE